MAYRWLLVSVLVVGTSISAIGDDGLTGNTYLRWSIDVQAAYIAGFIEGFYVAEADRATSASIHRGEINPLAHCLSKMSGWQIHAIIAKYLNANPSKWHERIWLLIWLAISDACR
jgi:hypothetical protein